MKKILKTLFGIAIVFAFVNSVNAATCSGKTWKSGCTMTISEKNAYSLNGVKCPGCYYNQSKGNFEDLARMVPYNVSGNNNSYPAYCLDVNLAAPTPYSNLEVKKVANAKTSAYYAGMVAIASNIGDNYDAGNIALRLFRIAMKKSNTGLHSGYSVNGAAAKYNYVLTNTAAYWMSNDFRANAQVATGAKNSEGNNCSGASCFWSNFGLSGKSAIGNRSSYSSSDKLSGTSNSLKEAKNLFGKGLEAAANYNVKKKANGENAVAVTIGAATNGVSSQTSGNKVVSKNYHRITLENFTKNDKITDISIDDSNLTITGYKTSKNGNVTSTNRISDIVSKLNSENKLYIEVTASKNKSDVSKNCEDFEYEISVGFYNSTIDDAGLPQGNVYILGSDGEDVQKFLVYTGGSSQDAPNTDKPNDNEDKDGKITLCGDKEDANKCKIIGGVYYGPDGDTITKEKYYQDCPTDAPQYMCEFHDGNYYDKNGNKITKEKFETNNEGCCNNFKIECDADDDSDSCTYYDSNQCDGGGPGGEYCHTNINLPTECQNAGDTSVNSTGSINAALDKNEKENIKYCLLRRKKDDAENSYKVEDYIENPYCSVYCMENYEIELPGLVSVNSGRYFKLEAKVVSTKKCYTSRIKTEKFKEDIEKLNEAGYNKATYDTKYNSIVNQYNSCVNMDENASVNYSCAVPTIKYNYDEEYYNTIIKAENGDNKLVSGDFDTDIEVETSKCNGEINDDYSCISTGSETVNYVSKTFTRTVAYTTPDIFYTLPDGGIVSDPTHKNAEKVDGLPVSLKTSTGRHKFSLTFTDIGEFYDKSNCELGRLIGHSNSVFNAKQGKTTAEYTCYYDVNCPDCPTKCIGENCEYDICDGPDCPVKCIGLGCAYTQEKGLNYTYRTVSLNNLNPSKRTLGYNWNKDNGNENVAAKANAAIDEITNNGDDSYDKDKLEYSFVMTPTAIQKIREYNKTQLPSGGYTNDNTLEAVTDSKNYKFYISTFLKDLNDGVYGDVNAQGVDRDADEKFTSWIESVYCQKNVCSNPTKDSGIGYAYK